jgi:ATP-binding cassette, subfamily B, bacterial
MKSSSKSQRPYRSRLSSLKAKVKAKCHGAIAKLIELRQIFQLIWHSASGWTVAWLSLLVIQGCLPGANVYLTRWLVDSLVKVVGIGTDWGQIQHLLLPGLLMAAVLLLGEVLQSLTEWIRTAQAELVQDHISGLIHQQSAAIDYGFYESSDANDQLSMARQDAANRSLGLLENAGSILQGSITLSTLMAVLCTYGVWLPMALLLSALPAFYVTLRLSFYQYQWYQRTTTNRRRLQYYDVVMGHNEVAAELRIFGLSPYFQSLYQRLRSRLRTEQLHLLRQQTIAKLGAGLAALFVVVLMLTVVGQQVLTGVLRLGDLALFYQAFNQGQTVIKMIVNNLGQIYKSSLFVHNLFEFLNLKPQIADPPNPLPTPPTLTQGIRFRQVTFRYPGSSLPILENFDMTIPSGQTIAIVGDNGAGKSTLLKLLCRLYDPESGWIEIDGIDIRKFAVSDLHRLITVLFQAPVPYFVSAAENISLGDMSAPATQSAIETAAKAAGIHDKIIQLEHGYDTKLGKWFPDATDLSGGEWQRLSLARAFFRKAQIIILDEPTSAMDPWAEFEWLERFRNLSNGRTTIVITHRFTLSMRADIIYVMRQGKVVESGNHNDLLEQNRLYAQSWNEQMQMPSGSAPGSKTDGHLVEH